MSNAVSADRAAEQHQPARRLVRVHPVAATTAVLFILTIQLLKYYPLRPATFVTSQYLWPYEAHIWRRGVVSTLASWLHDFDLERMAPVIEFASLIQLVLLAGLAQWLWKRAFRTSFMLVSSLVLVSSGFIPQLLMSRASQDGYAVAVCCVMGICLLRRWWLAAILLGVVSVAIHEASLPYVVSIVAVERILSSDHDRSSVMRVVVQIGVLVSPAVVFVGLAAAMTHVSATDIAAVCDRYSSLATEPFRDIASVLTTAELKHSSWEGNCGLPLRGYTSDLSFFIRSVGLGILFAPVTLIAIYRILVERRLDYSRKLACCGALLLPSLLLLAAYDTTRFWSYMNGVALFAIFRLESFREVPIAEGFSISHVPRGALFAVALFTLGSFCLYLGPLNWERQETPLPARVYALFKSPRQIVCGASELGACSRPVIEIK